MRGDAIERLGDGGRAVAARADDERPLHLPWVFGARFPCVPTSVIGQARSGIFGFVSGGRVQEFVEDDR